MPARSGLPVLDEPDAGAPTPGAAPGGAAREPLGARVDATGLAARLEMLGNSPSRVRPPAVVTAPGEDTGVVSTPPPATDQMRYLGGIFEPGRRFAVLVIGGRQRVIGEGERVPGVPEEGATLASSSVTTRGRWRSPSPRARAARWRRWGPASREATQRVRARAWLARPPRRWPAGRWWGSTRGSRRTAFPSP